MIPSQEEATERARVLEAAAEAARRTPGVAYLRPGFGDLVRGAAARYRSRTHQASSASRIAGVRAYRVDSPHGWDLRVHLAVVRGYRALDVTRQVRAAVTAAVRELAAADGAPEPRVSVSITVTDIA
ncbi:Asp23/Gls24 family envelope stress response protein [Streptomyces zagrosensis]|uniref:Asp23/Gls24 family envelope stress response protein n=1 Tax=Streptomyces zagrosensis TaxID=1042984 RepID=A0A7W9UZS1_9ACTN|nr:Asp23/Gls24 family envelope stress response protein [Streptomyces zagrosensis]MBB5937353.1 hypothetical protein [Streptomyces zagrosensis]